MKDQEKWTLRSVGAFSTVLLLAACSTGNDDPPPPTADQGIAEAVASGASNVKSSLNAESGIVSIGDSKLSTESDLVKDMAPVLHGWTAAYAEKEPGDGVTTTALVFHDREDDKTVYKFDLKYGDEVKKFVNNEKVPFSVNLTVEAGNDDKSETGKLDEFPGTYTCAKVETNTSGSCIVDADDELGLDNATLTFEPNDRGEVYERDEDYLTFGVWIRKPDDTTMDFTVGVFADGTMDFQGASDLSGTASYGGAAAGMYAKREDGDPTISSGMYTALVSLDADFGKETLVGEITGFADLDGDSLGSGKISLSGDLTEDTLIPNSGSADGSIGGMRITGNYKASFHGTGASGISGMFDAESGPLEDEGEYLGIIGAFGATKQVDE